MSATTGATTSAPPAVIEQPAWRAYLPVLLATAPFALVPLVLGDSRTFMGVAIGMVFAAGYAVGFNIIFGMTGQLFLCVGALAAVGGYGTGLLADEAGLPFVLALAVGTALAAALGALFSWISVRRSLDVIFTGIVTLTFSLGLDQVLLGWDLTGGDAGLRVGAADDTFVEDRVGGYLLALAVVALCMALYRWLDRSHFGWAFRALRDDETTAELAGVDVAHFRVVAGAIGSAVIGLTGGLYALHEGRISPEAYGFANVDVDTLVILAFGGIGTLLAPVTGTLFFGLLDEFVLRDLTTLRIVVYGTILTVLFLALRGGVAGLVARVRGGRAPSQPGPADATAPPG